MNDNISVPRELLERAAHLLELSALDGPTFRELRTLLAAATSAEVEGLVVIGFHCMDSAGIETLEWRGGSYADEPLCSMPKAQAIIDHLEDKLDYANQKIKVMDKRCRTLDQQAARIKELEEDAARWEFIRAAGGEATGRFHNLRPDARKEFIDKQIAMGSNGDEI